MSMSTWRNCVLAAAFSLVPPFCLAAGFDYLYSPKAVVVLTDFYPYLPRLVIYEDGEVIFFRRGNWKVAGYRHAKLAKNDFRNLQRKIEQVLALKNIKRSYSITRATDQPQVSLYLRNAERELMTSIWGLDKPISGFRGQSKSPPPDHLLRVHKWLYELDFPNSEPWDSQYIQVMFWDYSYAPGESIHWPKNWPDLKSERVLRHEKLELPVLYSIFLDRSMRPELDKFLASQKERGAIEINGQKMSATYMSPFPGQRFWQDAFRKAPLE